MLAGGSVARQAASRRKTENSGRTHWLLTRGGGGRLPKCLGHPSFLSPSHHGQEPPISAVQDPHLPPVGVRLHGARQAKQPVCAAPCPCPRTRKAFQERKAQPSSGWVQLGQLVSLWTSARRIASASGCWLLGHLCLSNHSAFSGPGLYSMFSMRACRGWCTHSCRCSGAGYSVLTAPPSPPSSCAFGDTQVGLLTTYTASSTTEPLIGRLVLTATPQGVLGCSRWEAGQKQRLRTGRSCTVDTPHASYICEAPPRQRCAPAYRTTIGVCCNADRLPQKSASQVKLLHSVVTIVGDYNAGSADGDAILWRGRDGAPRSSLGSLHPWHPTAAPLPTTASPQSCARLLPGRELRMQVRDAAARCACLRAAAPLTGRSNLPGVEPWEPNVNRVLPSKSVTCVLVGRLRHTPGPNNVREAAIAVPDVEPWSTNLRANLRATARVCFTAAHSVVHSRQCCACCCVTARLASRWVQMHAEKRCSNATGWAMWEAQCPQSHLDAMVAGVGKGKACAIGAERDVVWYIPFIWPCKGERMRQQNPLNGCLHCSTCML